MAEKDYYTDVEQGYLDDSHDFVRVVVKESGFVQDKIGTEKVQNGFGQTIEKAYEDFIRRNSSSILNKIFDRKE